MVISPVSRTDPSLHPEVLIKMEASERLAVLVIANETHSAGSNTVSHRLMTVVMMGFGSSKTCAHAGGDMHLTVGDW